MGGRVILPYGDSGEYVQKVILCDSILKELPSFDEYLDTHHLPLENIKEAAIRAAVEQQYNEWYIWYNALEESRHLLAPIIGTNWNHSNQTPILYFPRFTPLLNEEQVFKLNNVENLIVMGMQLQNLLIDKNIILEFLRELPQVCNDLNLNEEDIINNPSNLGYNRTFGLRIIDYGLVR